MFTKQYEFINNGMVAIASLQSPCANENYIALSTQLWKLDILNHKAIQ